MIDIPRDNGASVICLPLHSTDHMQSLYILFMFAFKNVLCPRHREVVEKSTMASRYSPSRLKEGTEFKKTKSAGKT